MDLPAEPGSLAYYLGLLSIGDQGWGDELLAGALLTLQLAFCSVALGLVFGLAGAAAKVAAAWPLRFLGGAYTTVIRGLPELLTLFLIYYGLQYGIQAAFGLFGGSGPVAVNGFAAGVLALSLVFGAYATEVFRGAILAVPRGQMEAARALGMPGPLAVRRILLPQVWRFALPGLGNLWLVLIKDTSLVSVIAFAEFMRQTDVARRVTKEPFFFFAVACLGYLTITGLSTIALAWAEKRAARGVRRPA